MEVPKRFDPAEVEGRWSAHWLASGYFTPDPSSQSEPFCIVIPPPNITGRLHAGHALNNTLQDVLVRWRRMQGRNTLWLPGTDHAGIATQMVVERELQKEGTSRHVLGREAFQKRVWAWKEEHGSAIVEQLKRLGASCDWSRLRFTLDEGLSVAVREVFVRLYEEGLIYRDKAIVNWCPSCRTALSDLEVVHKEVTGKLYSIRYPLKEGNGSITVATTRPETMLGDTAVAVHPADERYAALVGKNAVLPILGRELPIVADDAVDAAFGTGAVKVTPAHDPNDFAIGRRHGLPAVRIMDEAAKMSSEAGPYAGLDRYACRKKLLADLEASGYLVKIEEHRHAVGRCDRSDTVVEPTLSDQWFVRMEPLASEALRAVEDGRVRFVPENRRNDYYEWMRNIHDWCISRQLWWGHRIPAWHCARCAHITVSRDTPAACASCGAAHPVQDADVLDTWFSSALWPFSTLGWPDTAAADLRRFYPTSVLVTGYDILFFWVARMIMMGLKFMGEVPFPQVYFNGLVRDDKGRKMSKTRGNTVDPLELMERHGTDALRFTLAAMSSPGADVLLDLKRVEGYQAFANKIWNAARFTLMNLDPAMPPSEPRFRAAGKGLPLADRWIISRVNGVAAEVDAALEEFRFDAAATALHRFFWHEFCDWYLEMVKPALLGSDAEAARTARSVLLRTLDRALRLLHPFMPFLTEEIWQRLPHQGDSLVVAQFPVHRPEEHDEEAEREMQFLMAAVGKLRNLRAEAELDPGRKVEALFKTELAYPRRLLEEHASTVASLARLSGTRFVDEIPRDAAAVRGVVTGLEMALLLPQERDTGEERGRLSREMEKIDREIAALEAKLANDSFVSRAPAAIVEKVRSSRTELAGKRDKLEQTLAALSDPDASTRAGKP
ncbi:MAG TPA: valine--tRNA ligase [Candidatus Polarisedimenticolia bacterium]|nr:valine--tRNA ligase [Candidatus Polarisedimenticolia bacterium]